MTALFFFIIRGQTIQDTAQPGGEIFGGSDVSCTGNPGTGLHLDGCGELVVRYGKADRGSACGAQLKESGSGSRNSQIAALHKLSHLCNMFIQAESGMERAICSRDFRSECMGPASNGNTSHGFLQNQSIG